MSDSKKLDMILEITLASHNVICEHSDILFGKKVDGKFIRGLCETVRLQEWIINGIIFAGGAGLGTTAGALITHLMK
jgi:hypothetical protein